MSGKTRSFLLSLTIIAVILFSAFGTTNVYADGGTTPDPPPTETTSGSEEAAAEETTAPEETDAEATEAPAEETDEATAVPEETSAEATEVPTETPAEATPEETNAEATEVPAEATEAPVEAATTESAEATEEVTATPEPVATEASTEGSPAEEAAAPTEEAAPVVEEAAPAAESSVLDAVPENTTITVVDANGETQPLATQAAADAVAESDPIWCPAGELPSSTACTPSFTSFDALLGFLSGNATYSGPGTIYIQQGAYQGGEASIDFNSPAYDLSNIRNSDLTLTGGWDPATGSIDPATPSTFSNVPIIIGTSANPWGGSLTLSNIVTSFTTTFSNNANNQTMNGLSLYSTGSVTMVNVQVGNAPNNGAEVEAGGDVTIVDSAFDRNQIAGAKIIKSGGSVTVINTSFSNPPNGRRQDTGLDIEQAGAVTLVNVLANENRLFGTDINSSGPVSITTSVFSGTKHIQGTDFLGYGLQVVTPNAISLESVTANDNFLWGASLQAGGNIAISNSVFNANTTASPGFIDDTGLFILKANNVALSNVQASDNRLFGAQITASGTVSVVDSIFNNNRGVITTGGVTSYHGHGLQVNSVGGIFLGNVTADNNMLYGAQLTSDGEVDISFSSFTNTSTGSASNALGKGLEVNSGGNVSLLNVVADNNQTVGADIRAVGDVTLNNITANGNGADGVLIQALCTSVNGGTFSGNGGYGLNLGTSGIDPVLAPTFSNNGAGNLFPATPPICTLLGGSPTTPGTATGGSPTFAALPINPPQDYTIVPVTGAFNAGSASTGVTLKSILAQVAGGGFFFGIFTGQYSYIYTDTGLQIFVLSTPPDPMAVRGVFRAY